MANLSMGNSSQEAIELLADIGGNGPLKTKIAKVLTVVSWRDRAAANRVRHLLRGEQMPTPEQVDDIRAAHARHCVEKVQANRAENERLISALRRFIDTASVSDPDFFERQIAGALGAIDQLGNAPHHPGGPDRPRT